MPAYLKASIKRSFAEGFLNELERNQNQYFLFFGKNTPWANDNSPDTYSDTVAEEYKVSRNIIGYKKINPSNILFAIPKNYWSSGTVYGVYSDSTNMFVEGTVPNFYIITDKNNIYKCLARPSGARSTVQPSYVLSEPFTTSDGYTWKYLGTIKESNLPYEFSDYAPIDYAYDAADTETTNQYSAQIQAVSGKITRLDFVTNGGASAAVYNYSDAYIAPSSNYISVLDYQVIDGKKYVYASYTDAGKMSQYNSPTNYIGYCLQITDSSLNTQEINNYGIIVDAGSTGDGLRQRYFQIADDAVDFSATPTSGLGYTRFSIVPHVRIYGDGNGAFAFPVLDTSKKIKGVNLANGGYNYSQAFVKVVTPKDSVTKVHPTITPVVSPKGGHASNILKELNIKDIIIIVQLGEEDADILVTGGQYRQFGIVKNPLLNNSTVSVAGSDDPYYRDITLGYSGSVLLDRTLANSLFNGSSKNFLLGAESSVGSSIIGWKSISTLGGENRLLVKVKNVGGNYITYNDRKSDFYVKLPTVELANSFLVGEKITQNVNAGQSQGRFVVRAEAYVLEKFDNILKIRVTRNSFVYGTDIVGAKSKSTARPSSVLPVYGEYALVFDTAQNTFYTENGSTNVFKIISVGSPYFDLNETPSYSGLSVLHISTSVSGQTGGIDTTSYPLTPNSFNSGDFIQQGISTDSLTNYASAVVYDWNYVNPSYGKLYVNDVFGTFKNVEMDGITGCTLGAYIVGSVDPPDIDPTSGEIIYINNIRPISRIKGQKEEFRMRLGF